MSRQISLAVVFAVVLTGCSTPAPVRGLAADTATNTSLLASELDTFAQDSARLAEFRADIMGELELSIEQQETRLALRRLLLKESGQTAVLDRFRSFETFADKVIEIRNKATETREERRKRILETRQDLVSLANSLYRVSGALANLSQEEDFKTQVKFLVGFAKAFKNELDRLKEQKQESEEEARNRLETTGGKTETAGEID